MIFPRTVFYISVIFCTIGITTSDSVVKSKTLKGREKGSGLLVIPIEGLTKIIDIYNKTLVFEKRLIQLGNYNPEDLIDDTLFKIENQLDEVSIELKKIEDEEQNNGNKSELKKKVGELIMSIYGDTIIEAYLEKVKLIETTLETENKSISADMNAILERQKFLDDFMFLVEDAGIYLRSGLPNQHENLDATTVTRFDNAILSDLLNDLENMQPVDLLYKKHLEGKLKGQGVKWQGVQYPITKVVGLLDEWESELVAKIKENDAMLRTFRTVVKKLIEKLVMQTIQVNDKYIGVGLQVKSMADSFIDKHEKLESRFLRLKARLELVDMGAKDEL